MTQVELLIQRYIDSWNEIDPARRRSALDEIYVDDCSYIDPLASIQGRAAINDFLGNVQQQFAGVKFQLASRIDAHHDQVRFTWHAHAGSATEPVAIGVDVAILDRGRIRCVYGFLDKAPS